jgi:hypothetical protein
MGEIASCLPLKPLRRWLALAAVLSSQIGLGLGCKPTGKECYTLATMELVADAASLFRTRTGRWPTSQEEMWSPPCAGTTCILVRSMQDGWRKEIRLSSADGALRIGSAGPNGRFEVDGDDLWLELLPGGARKGRRVCDER